MLMKRRETDSHGMKWRPTDARSENTATEKTNPYIFRSDKGLLGGGFPGWQARILAINPMATTHCAQLQCQYLILLQIGLLGDLSLLLDLFAFLT